jgi:drug/metabolite transporter (DMT)-like permease
VTVAVLLALAAAVAYGVSDFTGGSAARRARPLAVTAVASIIGLLGLPILLLLAPGQVGLSALGLGFLAGAIGGIGLALYFTGMRDAAMGIVSPLSAVAAASLPVGVGVVLGERPSVLAWVGIAIALPAIWLATQDGADEDHVVAPPPGVVAAPHHAASPTAPATGTGGRGVVFGLVSGACFGLFFVLLDATPADSGAWPLVGAKLGSIAGILLLMRARGTPLTVPPGTRGLVTTSGLTDTVANLAFLLATRAGLLSVASVVSSQYPIVVVVLSVVLLGERLQRAQQAGAVLALLAVALITLG